MAKPRPTTASGSFSSAADRRHRWAPLTVLARRWAAGSAKESAVARKEAADDLARLAPFEALFAYPGPRLLAALRDLLASGNAGAFSELARKVEQALASGSYRHDARAWESSEESESSDGEYLPPSLDGPEAQRHYIAALSVTPSEPSRWQRARHDLRRLRRAEDPFVYELVQVGSLEDALVAALFNGSLQAVVIQDGFPYRSKLELPELEELLARVAPLDESALSVRDYATTLARLLYALRPE